LERLPGTLTLRVLEGTDEGKTFIVRGSKATAGRRRPEDEVDGRPVHAIELDDKTHQAAKRVATDQRKSKATADAGIRLIRWPTKSLPDRAEIEAAFTVKALAAVGTVQ